MNEPPEGATDQMPGASTRRRQRNVAEAGDRRPSATRWRRCVTTAEGRQ